MSGPRAAPRPCSSYGCPELAEGKATRCPRHAREARTERDRHRPNAGRRGYGSAWRRRRAELLRRRPTCEFCGLRAEVVDHIQPRSAGGSDAEENLRPLCKRCHDARTARDVFGPGRVSAVSPPGGRGTGRGGQENTPAKLNPAGFRFRGPGESK
jgi:5-methylcytosine-specific restriction protein A